MPENKHSAEYAESNPFIQRVIDLQSKIDAASGTRAGEIRAHYHLDRDLFEEKLDELVGEVANEDEEYQAALADVKLARSYGPNKDAGAVAALREVRDRLKETIVSELGLSPDAGLDERKIAQNKVDSIIDKSPEPITNVKEALTLLGVTHEDDNGKVTHSFPYEHMPPSVIKDWEAYLASVYKQIQALHDFQKTRENGYNAESANDARIRAHNQVTRGVHDVLNLEKIDPRWKFDDTRNLLAQIRETLIPNESAALTPKARQFVVDHTDVSAIAKALM